MAGGNRANLDRMTFLEFMASLDREIQRREEENRAAQKQAQKLRQHK